MIHSDLIFTLVSAFVAAFAGGFIAARVGLPPIVGYLLAGVVIGPYTPGGSASASIASDFAEVGVILLMFGVGLNFSAGELMSVGKVAIPGSLVKGAIATLLGLVVALQWGWSPTEGLMLGLCLSIASTVVLLRALEDQNLLETHAGRLAVGWVVAEDLFTVLILVLLPALAGNAEGSGLAGSLAGGNAVLAVVLALAQTALFVFLMLFLGTRLIPRLLVEVVKTGSRELFTLCILAIALGVSFGSAELFGASLALGAFLAGLVLNESELSHRAGLEALPLRDAFAVLFFVSVGMIFDPSVLVEEPLKVLQVVAIVVIGKAVASFIIVSVLGYGIRAGIIVGGAIAQVGEFSFVLAALGRSLDLLPAEATSLILGASIISITLNPVFFKNLALLERILGKWQSFTRFAERRAPEAELAVAVHRHVVICGYGRTGSSLARTLRGRSLPFVVIETNPFTFERARADGVPCILGDASLASVLEQAQVGDARALAVTFADQPRAPITVQNARELNPDLHVVARSLGPGTDLLLIEAGASEVVDPNLEAGLEFTRYILHRYGIDAREILALQMRVRAERGGG